MSYFLFLMISSFSQAELETLRRENERLKECEGAIGGTGAGASALPRGSPNSPHQTSRFLRSQTLALRQAAASAENNLRCVFCIG